MPAPMDAPMMQTANDADARPLGKDAAMQGQDGCAQRDALPNALVSRVWRTVAKRPDAPAFRMLGTEPTSYQKLWNESSVIAGELHAAAPGRTPVIVIGSKSPLTIAAFIACLRSGHAYVPVDPSMPASRVRSMSDQIEAAYGARPAILGTLPEGSDAATYLDALPAGSRLLDVAACVSRSADRLGDKPQLLDAEPASQVAGEDTQYVIFTSGSTGAPKGIEITEDDVRNFMGWLEGFPAIRDGAATFIDQAPYSFDLSEYEVVGALATGGCLYGLTPDSSKDFKLLFEELADSHADVWVSTPPFADLCLADPSFKQELMPELRLFLFCGDTLEHRTARKLLARFPEARVTNTYGPTESTVAVTSCEIDEAMAEAEEPLPVGYPRRGTELRIMASDGPDEPLGKELPSGASGEIVIVGDTVAKGYLGNPEKTAAAFSAATLAGGKRVRAFRTGDIGHLDEDGMLHYEGRMGSLVKLNGFRIELGDVEMHLCALKGVKMAAVVPQKRAGRVRALKGYVVLDHADAADDETPQAIKRRLGELVPPYMVPRTIKVLPSMPLTANGKIDRKLLAAG